MYNNSVVVSHCDHPNNHKINSNHIGTQPSRVAAWTGSTITSADYGRFDYQLYKQDAITTYTWTQGVSNPLAVMGILAYHKQAKIGNITLRKIL